MLRNVTLDAEKSAATGPRAGAVSTWARLIQQVDEVDPLEYPQCGGVLCFPNANTDKDVEYGRNTELSSREAIAKALGLM